MIKIILNKILYYIIKNRYYYILAIIYRFFIFERLPNGNNKLIHSNPNNRVTIFALDSDRYRGDLDVLASSPLLRVLCIRNKWQGVLIRCLYKNNKVNPLDYSRSLPGSYLYDKVKKPAQMFMCDFLKVLFSIIKVDCVTSVSYRYIDDIDWTLASEKNNIPYIVFYRECLLNEGERMYSDVVDRHKLFNFHGSHIIVHNETCKKSFIESSFFNENKISVIGALRMDKYLTSLKRNYKHVEKRRKRFILFYFPYNMSLFGKSGNYPSDYKYKYAFSIWPEREKYFEEVHSAIAELAIEFPNIDFVIKPKNIMMKSPAWKYYERVLDKMDFNVDKYDNYSIEPNSDVHDLILNSDVICSLQSSTVIESAISGKPVILPIFENYRSSENYKDFFWKKHIELFNIPNNKKHFKELIIDLISHPNVSESILNKRKKIFKFFFNDLEGVSLDKYVNVITNVVESNKCQNRSSFK